MELSILNIVIIISSITIIFILSTNDTTNVAASITLFVLSITLISSSPHRAPKIIYITGNLVAKI